MHRLLTFVVAAACAAVAEVPRFRTHTIAQDLKGGYQVTVADLNRDGRPDLIALATGTPALYWFENPTWQRHLIAEPIERPINLAAHDLDGDRVPELVVAHGWNNDARKSTGNVTLLKHRGDPKQPWEVREIDRLPSAHRIRVLERGQGRPVFVNAPLTGAEVTAPEYRGPAPLVYYDPEDGWKRKPISDANQGVVHGLTVADVNGDGRQELLTASMEGVHTFDSQGGAWARKLLFPGDTAPWPKSGASEIALGDGGRFLATVEPWHGHQVAIYRHDSGQWRRTVVNTDDNDIHSISTADLDRDGSDEIVAAVRGKPGRVVIYSRTKDSWQRHVLEEGGITAANCAVADLNGDLLPDIACIGSATANLKWYENLGQPPPGVPAVVTVEKIAGQVSFYSPVGEHLGSAGVGQHPHEIVLSADGKHAYVSDNGILWMTNPGEGGNTISIIDLQARSRSGVIDLGNYRRPHGMDLDRRRNRLITTIENPAGLLLIDLNNNRIVRKYDTGGPAPHMALFGPDGEWAFASNTGGTTVAAIHLASGKTELIESGKRPQGSVLSPDGRHLYVGNSDSASVSVIDTARRTLIRTIPLSAGPGRVALTPDGKTLVYNASDRNAAAFVDVETGRETSVVPIGGRALSLTMSRDGRWAYAGIQDQDRVVVLSIPDRRISYVIATPKQSGPDPALPLP
jgi:YVTN family beta-propeller protein